MLLKMDKNVICPYLWICLSGLCPCSLPIYKYRAKNKKIFNFLNIDLVE